jgi:hypothetical protein
MAEHVRPLRYAILWINNLQLYNTYPSRGEQNRGRIIWKSGLPTFQFVFKPLLADITSRGFPEIIIVECKPMLVLAFAPLAVPLVLRNTDSISCKKHKYSTHPTRRVPWIE